MYGPSVHATWVPILMMLACDSDDPAAAGRPDGVDQRARLVEALQLIDEHPRKAGGLCLTLTDGTQALDCLEQVAAAQAVHDPQEALASCTKIAERRPELAERDGECFFRVAELAGEASWCDRARDFAFDCRMHLFSGQLRTWIPKSARPGSFEARASKRIQDAGLDPYDPRPWSAMYRWVLGAQRPLDRQSCALAPDTLRQEACLATAIAVFHDRLSHGRDRGWGLCEGPLPDPVTYLEDPVLDSELAARRLDDLCDPDAVRARPPTDTLPGSGP